MLGTSAHLSGGFMACAAQDRWPIYTLLSRRAMSLS